ncbi:MAG: type VI secretion system Vgr family protein [Deferrisomatales bacterium]|nr:type VI secretion system Vgr family protein [Deferrisomatales bacterium]
MPERQRITVSGPLGDDVLLFRSLRAVEELGRLFELELEVDCEDHQLTFDDILGQNLTVRVDQGAGSPRFFSGFVSRFSQAERSGEYVRYRATLRPWLWFLTRTADCRIFQGKTVPEIIKEVFREQGFSDFEELLSGSYRTWEYCVQYRETDFNFVSRLMEQEGIYYYFTHQDGKHTLVLSDSYSSHDLLPGLEQIPYYPPGDRAIREGHISEWAITRDVQPGAYALNDFDFEKPRASLKTLSSVSRGHDRSDYEVYDYPGEFLAPGDGETYARVRLEELQAQYERAEAKGDALGLAVGGLFALSGYPREDQDREYLILTAVHDLEEQAARSGGDSSGLTYECRFSVVDSQQPYRSPRTTPKPVVQGPQTAVVVGKAGEEIWTDKYGRVKVQFHWDRQGKMDENSSCWVRVAQVWAGKGWGGVHVPRIGQEVIIEFLEGDPDRPIVTGRVYNADCMPPYELPGNATQSGIQSRSTKGGGAENCNELRFEDKKGEEHLLIHAEKDQQIEVENDESHSVGHDRTKSVGNDETVSVGANRTEDVGENESITIGADRTENVGKNESISIGANRTEDVAKDESVSVGSNRSMTVGKKESLDVGDDRSASIGKNDTLQVGKNLTVEAGDAILFKTGSASISMKKNGEIVIKGKDITIQGSGKITVKASKDVVIKGSKIAQN